MRRILLGICVGMMVAWLCGCQAPAIKVGLLTTDVDHLTAEVLALRQMLESDRKVTCEWVSLDDLSQIDSYDMLWFHKIDSAAATSCEQHAGRELMEYVSAGGRLLLSMEAVPLLHAWGVEPSEMECRTFEARDEGFGRKVGFHAYRSHPLFDKLFGGAYTWHGKEDNTCRVWGYFDKAAPQAEGSRVIATRWEYIFYHPQDKVIWETPMGKGKVLSVGGFLYYDRDNFHKEILKQFTHNCVALLTGRSDDCVPARYWEERGEGVAKDTLPMQGVSLPEAVAKWASEPGTDTDRMSWTAGNTYVDLPSQRAVLVAAEAGGIEEIWTHPMLSLRDFEVRVQLDGCDTPVSLKSLTPTVELRPHALIRTYRMDGCDVREVIVPQVDRPATVVHYEWTGKAVRRVWAQYTSNLRFMWPYDTQVTGTLHYGWSEAANAFVVHDAAGEFFSLVGADVPGTCEGAGQYDGFDYSQASPQGIATDKQQVAAVTRYDVSGREAINLILVAGNEGLAPVEKLYAEVLANPGTLFESSASYYTDYLNNHVTLLSPDTLFNEAVRWATYGALQFVVHTPGIGTSLMAGYSSSRRGWGGAQKVSGRPGYAWYFGRDAVWSAFAFADMGDRTTVRQVLETLMRYQQVDGKIYHELTSSGSVHFDASDATPLFVNLMARYLKASGDLDFAKQHLPAVQKAMAYCQSTDTDGDHLIEISNVGHGWLEGGRLYGAHTEFYLVGLWNAALEDAAYLAEACGKPREAEAYRKEAAVVNQIINRDFWNEKGFYNYGKYRDGSYTKECIVLTSVPVYMGVTDREKSYRMVSDFASSRYSADWGVRMIDETNPIFDPRAYHYGSVWPLFTGWTALSEYAVGRYTQGYAHILSNVVNYNGFAPGRMPEVIHGSTYRPAGVTLHQCWSETMVLQPVMEGMLGYAPDAMRRTLTLAPRIPVQWNTLQVKRLRVGDTSVDMEMHREKGRYTYRFTSDKALQLHCTPAYVSGTEVQKVLVNGAETPFEQVDASGEYEEIAWQIPLQPGVTEVEVHVHEGSALYCEVQPIQPDATSQGVRILEQATRDKRLTATLEGRAGANARIQAYLPNGFTRVEGLKNGVRNEGTDCYTFEVDFGSESLPYAVKQITIEF